MSPDTISLNDMAALVAGTTGSPPMLGGVKAFNGPACTGPQGANEDAASLTGRGEGATPGTAVRLREVRAVSPDPLTSGGAPI